MSAPRTLFVCGVSGVGKTYLIENTIGSFPTCVTWRASALIQQARAAADADSLRHLAHDKIAESQELLVRGLKIKRAAFAGELILLDGHSVIDTESGFFDVSPDVVRRLEVHSIAHVEDGVEAITRRRSADLGRRRPQRSDEELARYQARSIQMCELYHSELGLPLNRLRAGDGSALARLIESLLIMSRR